MKRVCQLDNDNYFIGMTNADESPLEPGVYLIPKGAIDVDLPIIPEGKRAKWNKIWVFEDLPNDEVEVESPPLELTYAQSRSSEYPPITDYIDGIVKGDQEQIDEYIAKCQAVKDKYPKPTE